MFERVLVGAERERERSEVHQESYPTIKK